MPKPNPTAIDLSPYAQAVSSGRWGRDGVLGLADFRAGQRAAKELGLARSTFMSKLKKWGLV